MQKKLLISILALFTSLSLHATPSFEDLNNDNRLQQQKIASYATSIADQEALIAFHYLLTEVTRDAKLSNEEQEAMVKNFEAFASEISSDAAPLLVHLLLEETQTRVLNMLQNAALDDLEVNVRLTDYKNAILGVQNMNIEIARQMLFFVAELKIHRQYVYEYGIALGCPEAQLLRHDLSKLSVEQFEGYARYFRGGKKAIDRARCLSAWLFHQNEEHHHQSYQKEGFSFDEFSEKRLRNNMQETVADVLASAKQRGGGSTIDWLVNAFPKQKPHYRLIPFLQEAFIKAHTLYLEAEANPDSDSIFKGSPCWSKEVEDIFTQCALPPDEEMEKHEDCCFCCNGI